MDKAESKKEEVNACEEDKSVKSSESAPEESSEMPEEQIEEISATIPVTEGNFLPRPSFYINSNSLHAQRAVLCMYTV